MTEEGDHQRSSRNHPQRHHQYAAHADKPERGAQQRNAADIGRHIKNTRSKKQRSATLLWDDVVTDTGVVGKL